MPRYMIQGAYTTEALAAFVSKPQDRVSSVRALTESMGAKLESFDFCLGDYDVVATYTAPDDTAAVAIALAVTSAGHLKSFKTTKLISPEDFTAASQKASGVSFQPPSRG